jgi:hypothetical protein
MIRIGASPPASSLADGGLPLPDSFLTGISSATTKELSCIAVPSGDIPENKKADVAEHPKAFDHVGLLVNEPPGTAELLSI